MAPMNAENRPLATGASKMTGAERVDNFRAFKRDKVRRAASFPTLSTLSRSRGSRALVCQPSRCILPFSSAMTVQSILWDDQSQPLIKWWELPYRCEPV